MKAVLKDQEFDITYKNKITVKDLENFMKENSIGTIFYPVMDGTAKSKIKSLISIANKTKVPILIKLDDIKIKTSKKHSKDIRLDDTLTLRMKYPSMKEFIKSNFSVEGMKPVDTFDLIISCIEQVYSQDESWSASDCTKDEMNDFLDQLNSTQFKEIEMFFETMPRLSHTLKVKNPKTNVENDIKLEGLTAFFG